MRTVAEHRAVILNLVRPLPAEWYPASDAEGLTLREDVHAAVDLSLIHI